MEFDIGANGGFNGDTTRVDGFGLPIAMHLHSHDGSDIVVGEDYSVFQESRSALFQQFVNVVPAPLG